LKTVKFFCGLLLKNILISFSTVVISDDYWSEFQWKKDGSSSKFWLLDDVWELFDIGRKFKRMAAFLNNVKASFLWSWLLIQTV